MDLVITGPVEKFVTIQPRQVNLRGYAGDPVASTVTITPGDKYPFKIVNSRARDGKNIRYRLETVKTAGSPAYKLKVENVKPDSGHYYDAIVLDTDSKIRPQVTVRVFGFLRAPRNEVKKSSSGVQ
jgi:hypothetical protein